MTFKQYFHNISIYTIAGVITIYLFTYLNIKFFDENRNNPHHHYKFNIKNKDYNIVLIGDSSLKNGVVSNQVYDSLGLRTVNLGTSAASGYMSYKILIERYLENNKKPNLVIYYFNPSAPYQYLESTYNNMFEIIKYGNMKDLLEEIELYKLSPVLKTMVQTIRHSVNRYRLESYSMSHINKYINKLKSSNGYEKSPNRSLPYTKTVNSKREERLNLSFMEEFKSFAKSKKIRLLFYLAPMPQGEEGYLYFKDVYSKKVENKILRIDNKYFTDYTHLNPEGAIKNTNNLIDFLKVNY